MNKLERWKKKIHSLSKAQKIEFVLAMALTIAIIVGVPVYAWFVSSVRMEVLTKVKAPVTLDIKAGHKEDIEYLVLGEVDIEYIEKQSTPKRYVFCVNTGRVGVQYDIQLAHTTNIPFTYTLYKATEESSAEGADVIYLASDETTKYYYKKNGSALSMTTINADSENAARYGRTLALQSGTVYDKTYDAASNDGVPEIYAVPLYSQVTVTAEYADFDYYILELGLDTNTAKKFEKWNMADNNKETDVIYLSASFHSQ